MEINFLQIILLSLYAFIAINDAIPVSYTHLDVYKRQYLH